MKRKRLSGGLEGDFSRFRFDRRRNDSSVRLLQGRVLLDSDWNEQAEIQGYRRRRGFADMMGPAAAPAEDAGFGIASRSLLTFDGERHFIVIGGQGVDVWGGGAGFAIEIFFVPEPERSGVLLGRFSHSEEGSFGHDFTLAVESDSRLLLHVGGSVYEAPMRVLAGRSNHLALTWRRGRATWLLNGRSSSFDVDLPMRRAKSVVVLGATLRAGQPTQSFAGQLHELRFWGTDRSASELRSSSRPGSVGSGAPFLAGLWFFDVAVAGQEIADHGPHGVPASLGGGRAANAPVSSTGQLSIEPGRFWIEGLLCHQDELEELAEPTLDQLREGLWLFYLEAYEYFVSATEDPSLMEPALAGIDTSARSRILSKVRALRLPEGSPRDGEAVLEQWRRFDDTREASGTLMARRQGSMIGVEIGNLLYRVEVRSHGAVGGAPWMGDGECVCRWLELEREGATCVPARARLRLDRWPRPDHFELDEDPEPWRPGDAIELRGEDGDEIDQLYAAVVEVEAGNHELVIEAENLERFADFLDLRLRRLGTFVWSRDNASVLFAVESVSADGLEVQLQTTVRGFDLEIDQWVEWVGTDPAKTPGTLHKVVAIDKVLGTVELDPPAPTSVAAQPMTSATVEGSMQNVLRRWDQVPIDKAPMVAGAVVMQVDGWQPLESGIEVRFLADGPYRAGDYWWLPARTALSDIEWPLQDGEPEARAPDGLLKRRALLAAVARAEDGDLEVVDFRRTFQPMINGAVSKAGDTMYGPLRIESDLEVAGGISGRRLFGPLATGGAVAAMNLQDDAVTARALAPDVGVVPPAASILGDTAEAPPGYRFTGAAQLFYHRDPAWCRLEPMPRTDSRSFAAAAAGKLWLVYESGEVWTFDPSACCWQPGPPLPDSRQDFALASLGDAIYLAGGTGRGGTSTWCLDPRTGGWESCAPLQGQRSNLAMVSLEGHLYAFGGLEGQKASDRLEAFDPVLDRWHKCRPLPRARFDLAGGALCGRAYALGGAIKPTLDRFGCRLVSTVEAYHPASDRWLEHLAHLKSPRSHVAAAAVGDHLFAAGGRSTAGVLDLVDEYEPALDFWRHQHQLSDAAPSPAAASLDGWIYVFGVDENGLPSGVRAAKIATELFVHQRLDVDMPHENVELDVVEGAEAAEITATLPDLPELPS